MWDMCTLPFLWDFMATNVTVRDAGATSQMNFNNHDGDGSGALALRTYTFGA